MWGTSAKQGISLKARDRVGWRRVCLGCLWISDQGQNIINGFFTLLIQLRLRKDACNCERRVHNAQVISFFAIHHDELTSWKGRFQILSWNHSFAKNQKDLHLTSIYSMYVCTHHLTLNSTGYYRKNILPDYLSW